MKRKLPQKYLILMVVLLISLVFGSLTLAQEDAEATEEPTAEVTLPPTNMPEPTAEVTVAPTVQVTEEPTQPPEVTEEPLLKPRRSQRL
ncbi:MAG: hypothetical protein K8L99_13775 [Anaerolineae bacterium]|nr:hypothetical protein [Anaerolineae bacterium]